MAGALLRRIFSSLGVLFGVSLLIFILARVIPGDPARIALGPMASPEQVEALRRELYLDRPLPLQYLEFLRRLARGDLGISTYSKRPVVEDLKEYLPATLELIFFAGALMALVGLPLGILAAHFRDRWPDALARVLALLGVVTPSFVWAVFLMLVFSYVLGWLPVTGRLSEGMSPPPLVTGFLTLDALLAGNWVLLWDALRHLVLPVLALSLAGLGQAARLTRTNLLEVYAQPYIETARAFGLSSLIIAVKYALKPSLAPTLTILGLDFAALLGSAFLVEAVFNWPGLARYMVQATLHKDLNAIVGTALVVATFFLMVNLLVDLFVAWLNPQLRGGKGEV